MTPHPTSAETEWLAGGDAAVQHNRRDWRAQRNRLKGFGRQTLAWLKMGLKHMLIAAYIGLLLNIALTFAGY